MKPILLSTVFFLSASACTHIRKSNNVSTAAKAHKVRKLASVDFKIPDFDCSKVVKIENMDQAKYPFSKKQVLSLACSDKNQADVLIYSFLSDQNLLSYQKKSKEQIAERLKIYPSVLKTHFKKFKPSFDALAFYGYTAISNDDTIFLTELFPVDIEKDFKGWLGLSIEQIKDGYYDEVIYKVFKNIHSSYSNEELLKIINDKSLLIYAKLFAIKEILLNRKVDLNYNQLKSIYNAVRSKKDLLLINDRFKRSYYEFVRRDEEYSGEKDFPKYEDVYEEMSELLDEDINHTRFLEKLAQYKTLIVNNQIFKRNERARTEVISDVLLEIANMDEDAYESIYFDPQYSLMTILALDSFLLNEKIKKIIFNVILNQDDIRKKSVFLALIPKIKNLDSSQIFQIENELAYQVYLMSVNRLELKLPKVLEEIDVSVPVEQGAIDFLMLSQGVRLDRSICKTLQNLNKFPPYQMSISDFSSELKKMNYNVNICPDRASPQITASRVQKKIHRNLRAMYDKREILSSAKQDKQIEDLINEAVKELAL